ncbi:MAG: glycosyltransferase family 4 protein [Candidatus Saccharimonadales bacterium]
MLIAIDARLSGTTTGRYVDKLIEYIAKIDPDYDFNIICPPDRVEYFKKIAPKYYIYETGVKQLGLGEQTTFLKQVKEIDADLVHFTIVQQPIFYRGKVVTTIQDLTRFVPKYRNKNNNYVVFRVKLFIYKWVTRIAAQKSIYLITPTKYVMDDVVKFTGQSKGKFTVTYEAADKVKDKAEPYKKLVGKKYIMYVGNPFPHKNLDRLIEAFEILKVKYPNLYLVLVGKKTHGHDSIEQLIKSRGIENVILTGFVSEGQLRWFYENCAAYVFPSLSEGFGLPPLEAMHHGAPVVSSNATCLPEVYGDSVEYFDPLDTKDMANAISRVLNNKKLKDKLIKKGYDQVAKYSWERMARQTLVVYKKALND